MGTDLQGRDYTKAAIRALRDALWHNSLTIAPALGCDRDAMQVDIEVGVAQPDAVDTSAVAAVLPYGQGRVRVSHGGLDVVSNAGQSHSVIANVAAVVYLDLSCAVLPAQRVGAPVAATESFPATGVSEVSGKRAITDESEQRQIILEMGSGNDLYGEDYTKACRRAVHDAMHHSTLILFRSLGIDYDLMDIRLRLGVQAPDAVDRAAVAAEIPFGSVTVDVESGGLNVVDPDDGTTTVIATAALAVSLPRTALAGWASS